MNPLDLPVYQQKDRILAALQDNRVIVVESPTGSGKTTQRPQILYQAGYGRDGVIGVTQPRRIAAVSVAGFVARQMGRTIPDIVGYKMRFEDRTDLATRIKIMTDGILLQEMKADYDLSRYSVIMVDEAHERSLNIDFILGLLKRILSRREEFKVIISSATINAEVFSEYFDECPVVKIDTITYPIHTIYNPPEVPGDEESILEKITMLVDQIGAAKEPGDILVFLPGERAIKDCTARLTALRTARRMEILPLYGRLTAEEQERVFLDFDGKRKVIVATNIAETSVTIDGVTTVIDPGQAKLNFYNQRSFTSSLIEVPISKASCNQRKGRAGRTAPGVCYRLYTRKEYEVRSLFTREEILRTDLSEVVLRMAELGIRDFEEFDFLSPPPREGIVSAIETLRLLGAIDENRDLTSVGQMMCLFPLMPKHSRIIVEAVLHFPQVIDETTIAAAFLSSNNPFLLPQGEEMAARRAHHQFRDPYGDFLSYLKIFRSYTKSRGREKFCERAYLDPLVMAQIANIKTQLEEIVSNMGVPISSHGDVADYLCSVSRGLIQFVCAQVKRGVYRSPTAGRIMIHPGSVMWGEPPSYIVAGEIVRTTRMYARSVSKLRPEWLKRISPELHQQLVSGPRRGKGGEARDFTNQIRIGSGVFELSTIKGKKKVAQLPWEQLKTATRDLDPSQWGRYRKLRGTILYGDYQIMADTGLETILSVAPYLDPENGLLPQLSQDNFQIPGQERDLSFQLENLLLLSPRSKKSRRLGFVSLHADGNGTYWLKSVRGFYSALTRSLGNLESMIDELSEGVEAETRERINSAFRRLTTMLEE
jgi:RNA helicase HrpA